VTENRPTEADRLLRLLTDVCAAEFGHDQMMTEERPDSIDLAYRAAMAYLGAAQ
jgi:hypothetical protein